MLEPSEYSSGQDHASDSFDVGNTARSLITIARVYRKTLVLTCLSTMALITLYLLMFPPIYKAEAVIMAEPNYDYQRDTFYTGWDIFRKDEARSEAEMILAAPVLVDVVQKEQLKYEDVYHPLTSELAYMWEKSWVGRQYRGLKGMIFGKGDPDAPTPEQIELGRTVAGLRASVEVNPVGESNVGRLSIKGPSRRIAQTANVLLDTYLEHRDKRHLSEAEQSFNTLHVQVVSSGAELEKLSEERVRFSEENNVSFDFQKEGIEVSKLAELESRVSSTRAVLASLRARLEAIDRQLSNEPSTETIELNALQQSLRERRQSLRTTLIDTRTRYRGDAPEVRELEIQLALLDSLANATSGQVEGSTTEGLGVLRGDLISRRNSLQIDLAGSAAELAVMEETASRMRSRLAEIPSLQNKLMALDRNLAVASEKYKQLLVKEGQAQTAMASSSGTIGSVRIVEYATPPGSKFWPKPKLLYPLGLLLGLGLGLCIATIRSLTSGRILREHLEHGRGSALLYGNLPVLVDGQPITVLPRGRKLPAGIPHE